MKVSLIIPTYNREEVLVDSIRCALRQEGVDYEVIVVDQTPVHDQATSDYLREVSSRIKYHYSEEKGLTRARNTGFRLSSGDVLVFIDDDTLFEPDFLAYHLKAHQDGCDVVQGRVIEEGSPLHSRPIWITPWLKFRGGNNCLHDGATNNVTGCNFSVSRAAYEALGGFDEGYTGRATREDSDFGYRAYKRGYKVWYASRASLRHLRIPSGGVKSAAASSVFLDPSHYYCELRFCRKNFAGWVYPLYKFRLRLRGRRAIRAMLKEAERRLIRDLPPSPR